MTVVLGIACEDSGHFFTTTRLVDDTLVAAHTWLDGVLDDCRTWRGCAADQRWYKFNPDDALDLRPIVVDGLRIAPSGHIRGEPLRPEAGMWRRILLLFCHTRPRPDVVLLARDLDGDPRRRLGLEQVRDGLPWPFKIAIAAPQPEIEAWLVSGFAPADPDEHQRLHTCRQRLSFDPTTASERLTSHPNHAVTDAKRVLAELCGAAPARRERCLDDRDLLRQRGRANGMTAFLDDIERTIVPAFAPR
jgi:hypothetical protein